MWAERLMAVFMIPSIDESILPRRLPVVIELRGN